MKWIERFSESVRCNIESNLAAEVIDGIERVPTGSTKRIRKEQSEWIIRALRALEAHVDEEKRTRILVETCPHNYPKKRIKEMKAK